MNIVNCTNCDKEIDLTIADTTWCDQCDKHFCYYLVLVSWTEATDIIEFRGMFSCFKDHTFDPAHWMGILKTPKDANVHK